MFGFCSRMFKSLRSSWKQSCYGLVYRACAWEFSRLHVWEGSCWRTRYVQGELLEGKVHPGTILLENTNCFPKLLYGLCFHWGEGFLLFNILVNHLHCQNSKFLPILWYKMVFPETWLALQVSSVVKWLFTSSASFSMSSLFCTYWFIGEVYIFWNPTPVAYMLI